MTGFPDITAEIAAGFPNMRGRMIANFELAPLTWFKVGGPAQVLYTPADEDDLSGFLAALDPKIPATVIGVGSNLLVRSGGVPGVVIRLARGFGDIEIGKDCTVTVGAALPDMRVARAAAEASVAGLSFLRGIPGSIGGALRMNGGAYDGETKDALVEARAVSRDGKIHVLTPTQMGMTYRHNDAPDDLIFTAAVFQGRPGNREEILAEMESITERREASQPIKSRTGGSTFKNPDPPGTPDQRKAWKLIDEAGCRGLRIGGAQMSEQHCNFMINTGDATADDLEALGEEVRRRVKQRSGVELHWEIKRIGIPAEGA
ncbi:MAG: UDP-N-acetylmuramate dehydrogenase [Rhodobiaceae bacterium]|nr:UDP-N-acetylmuramate dehydrogenase [Rhodobiaceae bacterium]MCC0055677.1 UDP-N-acetylmuramate dehydrogenase [Rhodobiaceae bacterium]